MGAATANMTLLMVVMMFGFVTFLLGSYALAKYWCYASALIHVRISKDSHQKKVAGDVDDDEYAEQARSPTKLLRERRHSFDQASHDENTEAIPPEYDLSKNTLARVQTLDRYAMTEARLQDDRPPSSPGCRDELLGRLELTFDDDDILAQPMGDDGPPSPPLIENLDQLSPPRRNLWASVRTVVKARRLSSRVHYHHEQEEPTTGRR